MVLEKATLGCMNVLDDKELMDFLHKSITESVDLPAKARKEYFTSLTRMLMNDATIFISNLGIEYFAVYGTFNQKTDNEFEQYALKEVRKVIFYYK